MIEANTRCFAQGLKLLAALTDEQYAERRGDWSPVGAQYRHVVEHGQCLLAGVTNGRVDYDSRARDQNVEQSRLKAIEATTELIRRLAELGGWPENHPLSVQMRCNPDSPEGCWAESTLGRELQFLVSHTIHHFALIKLLLANQPIRLEGGFGTAPSTLSHHRLNR